MPKGWGICQLWHSLFLLAVILPVPPLSRHCSEMWLRSAALKHPGRCGMRRKIKKKHRLLLQNLCLTGASTGGCVISRCGRGVQSQGFWVMGFFGAIGDLEELFTHNFIIGLLSLESMPVLLPTPSVQLFESVKFGPHVKAGWWDAEQATVMRMIEISRDLFGGWKH